MRENGGKGCVGVARRGTSKTGAWLSLDPTRCSLVGPSRSDLGMDRSLPSDCHIYSTSMTVLATPLPRVRPRWRSPPTCTPFRRPQVIPLLVFFYALVWQAIPYCLHGWPVCPRHTGPCVVRAPCGTTCTRSMRLVQGSTGWKDSSASDALMSRGGLFVLFAIVCPPQDTDRSITPPYPPPSR